MWGAWLSPGAMEQSDEDEEDNEEFLERLIAQTGREMPQRELEEHYAVLGELGSGTYGRVVLTEPRDGGEGRWEGRAGRATLLLAGATCSPDVHRCAQPHRCA